MASLLAEGTWPCIVQSASFGEDDKGSPQVQINVKITDGPSAGRQCTYEDQVNAKSALYIGRSCKAVGWTGKNGDLSTLRADVQAWIEKTGGKTTVEIRHIELSRGKKYDRWVADGCKGQPPVWDKPNSIGSGPRVLNAPSAERLNDANEAMRMAMQSEAGTPPANYDDAGPPPSDDIPFISCGSREPSPIAKVLR